MRTESRESEAAITALKTSLAPLRTDSLSVKPITLYRSTFSETTIESSTTIPIALTRASRETRLKLKPQSLYRMGEAERAMGMARITDRAVLSLPRNSRTIKATTRLVMRSSLKVLLIEAEIGPVES